MGYRDVILATADLYAYWTLGDTSGTTATDSGPNSLDGIYQAGVTLNRASLVPSSADKAIRLTGGATSYVTLPAGFADFGLTGLSIEFTVYPEALGDFERVFDIGNGGGTDNVMIYRSSTGSSLAFDVYDHRGHANYTSTTGLLTQNTAQHLVVAIDGSGNGQWYKNGAAFGAAKTGMALPEAVSRANCWIGKDAFGSAPNWTGGVDDLSLYNRALSSTEVLAHYTAWAAAQSVRPTLQIQVAWNPALDDVWPDRWTQPYADLGANVCLYECHVGPRAGHPDAPAESVYLVLDNAAGLYDPYNASSPVQPYLGLERPVRILVTQSGVTRCVYYGLIEAYKPTDVFQQGRGYTLTMRFKSPIQAILERTVFLPILTQWVPYDPTPGTLNHSILPGLFAGLTTNFETDTWLLSNEQGNALGGEERPVGAWLTQIARSSSGTYFVRPLYRTSAGGSDYEIVWQAKDSARTATAAWTAVDTAGDIEAPTEAIYNDKGLAA